MTLRTAWPRLSAALLATVAVYVSGGCSFFYDLNTTQCEVPADCKAFGAQFANTTCVNRVCVPIEETGGSTSTGGRANTGGRSSGGDGNGGTSGDSTTGGSETDGGTVSTGGVGVTGGNGGEGGTVIPPECTTNTDCIEAHVDQPYICRSGKCVELLTDQCPVLLPSNYIQVLKNKKAPIILGGFANMDNDANRKETKAVINWELAFNEFNTELGTSRPQLLGLICQGNSALLNLDESMPHLTQDVGVPGVITTLAPDALAAAWDYTQTPEYADAMLPPVFFMSTGAADLRLADLQDSGLVWHLLGDPRVLAATTASLVKRIEKQVNKLRQDYFTANPTATGVEDPSLVPLRVTLVYNDDPTMYDIAKVLTTPDVTRPETMLTFNGATAISDTNMNNYHEVKVEAANYHTMPNVANGNTELAKNPPHIIVAMATSEFPSMMTNLEASWGKAGTPSEGKPRPFYVLSHLLKSQATALATPMGQYNSGTTPINMRTVGVSYALAQDTHSRDLYNNYLKNLKASYPSGVLDVSSTENYYDGAYGLFYSVMGAFPFLNYSLDGESLRDAWTGHVIASGGLSVDIGPGPIAETVNKLNSSTYKMALWGTMGPPNFDRLSGTRTSTTSAWCMLKSGSTWPVQVDGLIYDPTTRSFTDPTMSTVPTCLQQYTP